MYDQTITIICCGVLVVLSFVLTLIATFVSFKVFSRTARNVKEVEELKANNVAVAIALSGMFLASALVLAFMTPAMIFALRRHLSQGMDATAWFELIGFSLGCLLGALVVVIATVWLGLQCFLLLVRRANVFAEAKNRDVAAAITLATVLVIMGLFLAYPLGRFVHELMVSLQLSVIHIPY
jgi:uncharacterized membrane protein YjfL (UPF0719 family)